MNKAKKELSLLARLEETFYGVEEKSIHPNSEITFEYSPGKFCIRNKNHALPNDSFMEMTFSPDYKILSYREKNALTGIIKDYNKKEIKGLDKYGIIGNFLRRDPRYITAKSKGYKKTSECNYTMILWDKAAKKLAKLSQESEGRMADVKQSAEILVEGNRLKRMIVKTIFLKKLGNIEKTFTDITFSY
ncbi:hypothetical protein FJZ53_03545 [Candidatus Woesearchaeota archaeon]|nr:hypothetical protein [Candidatus Woesearchaeota archaeon]